MWLGSYLNRTRPTVLPDFVRRLYDRGQPAAAEALARARAAEAQAATERLDVTRAELRAQEALAEARTAAEVSALTAARPRYRR